MQKIGLITRFDSEIIELQPDQIEYCEEINRFLRALVVNNGKIAVRDQQVIYFYQDWRMYCSFTVDAWEEIEEYELQIHPLFWNALPKKVEIIKLRFRGRNLVYHFKYLGDLPVIHAHIPGRWLKLIRDKYKL